MTSLSVRLSRDISSGHRMFPSGHRDASLYGNIPGCYSLPLMTVCRDIAGRFRRIQCMVRRPGMLAVRFRSAWMTSLSVRPGRNISSGHRILPSGHRMLSFTVTSLAVSRLPLMTACRTTAADSGQFKAWSRPPGVLLDRFSGIGVTSLAVRVMNAKVQQSKS